MNATIDIRDLDRQVIEGILQTSKTVIGSAVVNAIPSIRTQAAVLVDKAVRASPEFDSIINGQLGAELGIPNPGQAMDSIINTILQNLIVSYQPISIYARQLRGGLTVEILKSDFSDVLSASGASYTTKNGQAIPWLDWMLTEGDRVVIANYDIILQPQFSRTNTVIMGKTSRGGWRVPPQFSGTPRNNFLTRSMLDVLPDLEKVIEIEVSRRI